MIQLRKKGYSRDDLLMLYKCLTVGCTRLECDDYGCQFCKHRIVCDDLESLKTYVCLLLSDVAKENI